MIKRYYDPIKGNYVEVLHIGQDNDKISGVSISVYLSKTIKAEVTKTDEGFRVFAEDFLFNTQSFVFYKDDYVVFDKKKATIKVIPAATDELKTFMEEYLEV